MKEKLLEVSKEDGLQSRAAALFVKTANQFVSEITLEVGDERVNGKSIIGIMSLGIFAGEKVKIYCQGPDEEEALASLEKII
ncbi:HPr family phosphocarrier protein [Peptoniphilus sp. GNH]|nr:phosphocarrier, HPr family [Clostridiales bacterium KA00134]UHR02584.1 HPr family phosphocarrier protein [Peptoniphilus sp. GNH]